MSENKWTGPQRSQWIRDSHECAPLPSATLGKRQSGKCKCWVEVHGGQRICVVPACLIGELGKPSELAHRWIWRHRNKRIGLSRSCPLEQTPQCLGMMATATSLAEQEGAAAQVSVWGTYLSPEEARFLRSDWRGKDRKQTKRLKELVYCSSISAINLFSDLRDSEIPQRGHGYPTKPQMLSLHLSALWP